MSDSKTPALDWLKSIRNPKRDIEEIRPTKQSEVTYESNQLPTVQDLLDWIARDLPKTQFKDIQMNIYEHYDEGILQLRCTRR